MVYVVARMEIKPGCMEKFMEILMDNVPTVRSEDGCISYEVCRDIDSEKYEKFVTILECWSSEDALRTHQQSPHMAKYRENVRDLRERTTVDVMMAVN